MPFFVYNVTFGEVLNFRNQYVSGNKPSCWSEKRELSTWTFTHTHPHTFINIHGNLGTTKLTPSHTPINSNLATYGDELLVFEFKNEEFLPLVSSPVKCSHRTCWGLAQASAFCGQRTCIAEPVTCKRKICCQYFVVSNKHWYDFSWYCLPFPPCRSAAHCHQHSAIDGQLRWLWTRECSWQCNIQECLLFHSWTNCKPSTVGLEDKRTTE